MTQAAPTFAQGKPSSSSSWSIGGGWWNMSDYKGTVEDPKNGIEGTYVAISRVSDSYLVEFDWSYEDPDFICMVGDYIYPLSQGGGGAMGSFYLGLGYTNFTSASDLKDTKGFNVLIGFGAGSSFSGTARYDFLGKNQELLTLGASYSF